MALKMSHALYESDRADHSATMAKEEADIADEEADKSIRFASGAEQATLGAQWEAAKAQGRSLEAEIAARGAKGDAHAADVRARSADYQADYAIEEGAEAEMRTWEVNEMVDHLAGDAFKNVKARHLFQNAGREEARVAASANLGNRHLTVEAARNANISIEEADLARDEASRVTLDADFAAKDLQSDKAIADHADMEALEAEELAAEAAHHSKHAVHISTQDVINASKFSSILHAMGVSTEESEHLAHEMRHWDHVQQRGLAHIISQVVASKQMNAVSNSLEHNIETHSSKTVTYENPTAKDSKKAEMATHQLMALLRQEHVEDADIVKDAKTSHEAAEEASLNAKHAIMSMHELIVHAKHPTKKELRRFSRKENRLSRTQMKRANRVVNREKRMLARLTKQAHKEHHAAKVDVQESNLMMTHENEQFGKDTTAKRKAEEALSTADREMLSAKHEMHQGTILRGEVQGELSAAKSQLKVTEDLSRGAVEAKSYATSALIDAEKDAGDMKVAQADAKISVAATDKTVQMGRSMMIEANDAESASDRARLQAQRASNEAQQETQIAQQTSQWAQAAKEEADSMATSAEEAREQADDSLSKAGTAMANAEYASNATQKALSTADAIVKSGAESQKQAEQAVSAGKIALDNAKKAAAQGKEAMSNAKAAMSDAVSNHAEALGAMNAGRVAETAAKNAFALGESAMMQADAAGKAAAMAVQNVASISGKVSELAKEETSEMTQTQKIEHILKFLAAQDSTNQAVNGGLQKFYTGLSHTVTSLEKTRTTQSHILDTLEEHGNADDAVMKQLKAHESINGHLLKSIDSNFKLGSANLGAVEANQKTLTSSLKVLGDSQKKDRALIEAREKFQHAVTQTLHGMEKTQDTQKQILVTQGKSLEATKHMLKTVEKNTKATGHGMIAMEKLVQSQEGALASVKHNSVRLGAAVASLRQGQESDAGLIKGLKKAQRLDQIQSAHLEKMNHATAGVLKHLGVQQTQTQHLIATVEKTQSTQSSILDVVKNNEKQQDHMLEAINKNNRALAGGGVAQIAKIQYAIEHDINMQDANNKVIKHMYRSVAGTDEHEEKQLFRMQKSKLKTAKEVAEFNEIMKGLNSEEKADRVAARIAAQKWMKVHKEQQGVHSAEAKLLIDAHGKLKRAEQTEQVLKELSDDMEERKTKQSMLNFAWKKIGEATKNTQVYLKNVEHKLLANSVKTSGFVFELSRADVRKEDQVVALKHLVNFTVDLAAQIKNAKVRIQKIEQRHAKNEERLAHELQVQHQVGLIMGDLDKQTGKVDQFLDSLDGVMQGKAATMSEFTVDFKSLKAELNSIEGDLAADEMYYEHLREERKENIAGEQRYQWKLGELERKMDEELYDLNAHKGMMEEEEQDEEKAMREETTIERSLHRASASIQVGMDPDSKKEREVEHKLNGVADYLTIFKNKTDAIGRLLNDFVNKSNKSSAAMQHLSVEDQETHQLALLLQKEQTALKQEKEHLSELVKGITNQIRSSEDDTENMKEKAKGITIKAMQKLTKVQTQDLSDERAKEHHELKKDEKTQVATEQALASLSKWMNNQVQYVNNVSSQSHHKIDWAHELESHERWLQDQEKQTDQDTKDALKRVYFLLGGGVVFFILFVVSYYVLNQEAQTVHKLDDLSKVDPKKLKDDKPMQQS
eukprot:gnl/MRDRNA2_/MRDRNA2_97241_c0_seq1.p1 gnl/MRDRNA2_/MRDRNA2_97241_c0~~gnl/MRDRNA2_/MRDRNA2_97241_c0_seq1.p1  ORF type:complete len:1911 (+),score=446.89 gnl/MRDRNA2_/MRDRNA2_97241_c0_seq1:737-5734(+)